MPGVHSASKVEVVLSHVLSEILVASNTGSLERLGRNLFDLIRYNVDHKRKLTNGCFLSADIVDSDFGVRDTSVVS
jgi:hypothetical protein